MKQGIRRVVTQGALLAAALLSGAQTAAAQSVRAVPKLDLNQYVGVWYVVSRIPTKAEKRCLSDNMVLYALGDKARTFQMGTFCTVKGGNPDDLDATGKMDKNGTGKLKLSHLVFFSRKYWVLATGPAFDWALVGSPNHKTLWVLSKTASLSPDVNAEIQKTVSAEGFDPGKLRPVSRTMNGSVLSTR
ncbi:MAG: lipocalin family protein [Janthinobacterium lividum]